MELLDGTVKNWYNQNVFWCVEYATYKEGFMKRCYIIADTLTWGRLLGFSTLMLVAAVLPVPLWAGLTMYVVGVLSDMDGFFAKKYPYPNDGKHRWWRDKKFVALLDEAADATFGVCALVFFILRVDANAGWWFLKLALGIGVCGQVVLYTDLMKRCPAVLNFLLLLRRFLYFALIGVVLVMTTLAAFPKYWIVAIGTYVVIALLLIALGMVNVDRITKGSKD